MYKRQPSREVGVGCAPVAVKRSREARPETAESAATTCPALDGSRVRRVESAHAHPLTSLASASRSCRANALARACAALSRGPARALPRRRGVRAAHARHRKESAPTRAAELREAKSLLPKSEIVVAKSESSWHVREGYTRGYTNPEFPRLIPVRFVSPRRGESRRKGSCRCVQRLDLNAQASRLCESRALRLARSGCTQRRRECETRRRATLRVYTREARGPPRADLGARHRGGA